MIWCRAKLNKKYPEKYDIREDIIRTKLKRIEENVELINKSLPPTPGEFADMAFSKDVNRKIIRAGIYKIMEEAIQNLMDICSVINTDLSLGIPKNNEELIDNLVRSKIMDETMGMKLKRMNAFRNRIVHYYARIDDERTYNHWINEHRDFYDFGAWVKKFLEGYRS